jgi:hypothetical protein
MPFSRTAKATVYNRPAAVSGQESAEIRKRDEDLKITGRRLCKPIEAHPDHKKRFEIDKWDFVSPASSPEEQGLVKRIYDHLATDTPGKKPIDRAENKIIIRAGFHDSQPATYRQFIAASGSEREIIHVCLKFLCDSSAELTHCRRLWISSFITARARLLRRRWRLFILIWCIICPWNDAGLCYYL